MKRSVLSTIQIGLFWIGCIMVGTRKYNFYQKRLLRSMNKKEKVYEPGIVLRLRYGLKCAFYKGIKCVFLSNKNLKSNIRIIYLHGGAYFFQPSFLHWSFLRRLYKKTKADIMAPIYPKAPHHEYNETFEVLLEIYKAELIKGYDKIVLMGDSSGGGLAFAFVQYLTVKGVKLPDSIITFSPFLDATIPNAESLEIAKKDPMLNIEGVKLFARKYAGEYQLDQWMLSPVNGDLSKIFNTHIFFGTYDILYPDAKKIVTKADKQGGDVKLYLYEKQIHGFYQLFSPEARDVLNKVTQIVLK